MTSLTVRHRFTVDDFHRMAEAGILVIEVADSSRDYDRTLKVPQYARAGILEVWLIDPAARASRCTAGRRVVSTASILPLVPEARSRFLGLLTGSSPSTTSCRYSTRHNDRG